MAITKSDYFWERAADSAREAQGATLDNVRQRNLRSEAAWRSMAESAEVAEAERARIISEKADVMGIVEADEESDLDEAQPPLETT